VKENSAALVASNEAPQITRTK
jgi:hypothetical protein